MRICVGTYEGFLVGWAGGEHSTAKAHEGAEAAHALALDKVYASDFHQGPVKCAAMDDESASLLCTGGADESIRHVATRCAAHWLAAVARARAPLTRSAPQGVRPEKGPPDGHPRRAQGRGDVPVAVPQQEPAVGRQLGRALHLARAGLGVSAPDSGAQVSTRSHWQRVRAGVDAHVSMSIARARAH